MMTMQRTMLALGLIATGSILAFGLKSVLADGIPSSNPLYYSGTLTEGGTLVTGTRALTVNLWADGTTSGSPLCTTVASTANVTNGRFRIALASSCKAVINQNSTVFVEVIDGATSLGRSPIGAVPYAVEADHAVNAANAVNATNAANAANAIYAADAGHSSIADTAKGAASDFSIPGNLTVGGIASVGVRVSSTCTLLAGGQGVSRCTCGTNEVALSGGGFVVGGSPAWVQGSNPGPSPSSWDIACADASGNRTQCTAAYVVCARLAQ